MIVRKTRYDRCPSRVVIATPRVPVADLRVADPGGILRAPAGMNMFRRQRTTYPHATASLLVNHLGAARLEK